MTRVEGRRAPVAMEISTVHNHLRLIVGLRAGESGVQVEILGKSVVEAELQTVAEAAREIGLQSVVVAVALGEPKESSGEIRIRTARGHRYVLRALRHSASRGGLASACTARRA